MSKRAVALRSRVAFPSVPPAPFLRCPHRAGPGPGSPPAVPARGGGGGRPQPGTAVPGRTALRGPRAAPSLPRPPYPAAPPSLCPGLLPAAPPREMSAGCGRGRREEQVAGRGRRGRGCSRSGAGPGSGAGAEQSGTWQGQHGASLRPGKHQQPPPPPLPGAAGDAVTLPQRPNPAVCGSCGSSPLLGMKPPAIKKAEVA